MARSTVSLTGWTAFALLSAAFCCTASAANACFFPSGGTAASYVPCSPSGDGGCCIEGDFCTSLGYCISNAKGYHYRGACTDVSWGNPSCPNYCVDNTNSGNSSAVIIIACNVASTSGSWCCAYNGNCCSSSSYTPAFGTIFAEPVAASATSSPTSSPSSTPASFTTQSPLTSPTTSSQSISSSSSASATPGSDSSKKNNTSTITGAAAGVPLGLLALAGLVLFFLERRKRIRAEKAHVPTTSGKDVHAGSGLYSGGAWHEIGDSHGRGQGTPFELSGARTVELPGNI